MKKDINARELYLKLGLDKSNWSRWYKRNILNNTIFVKDIHWEEKSLIINGNEVLDFLITKDFAIYIINSTKTIDSENKYNIIKLYNLEDNIEIISRPEIEFGKTLRKFLNKWDVSIEPQFTILKYRIDFLINGYIAVEYDEEHHDFQKEEDDRRMKDINEYIKNRFKGHHSIEWVRVKKGNEIEGLSEIVEKLIECESLDCWDGKVRFTNYSSESFDY